MVLDIVQRCHNRGEAAFSGCFKRLESVPEYVHLLWLNMLFVRLLNVVEACEYFADSSMHKLRFGIYTDSPYSISFATSMILIR